MDSVVRIFHFQRLFNFDSLLSASLRDGLGRVPGYGVRGLCSVAGHGSLASGLDNVAEGRLPGPGSGRLLTGVEAVAALTAFEAYSGVDFPHSRGRVEEGTRLLIGGSVDTGCAPEGR